MLTNGRKVLKPVLKNMLARDGFQGLTIADLKTLASNIVVPYTPEVEEVDDKVD